MTTGARSFGDRAVRLPHTHLPMTMTCGPSPSRSPRRRGEPLPPGAKRSPGEIIARGEQVNQGKRGSRRGDWRAWGGNLSPACPWPDKNDGVRSDSGCDPIRFTGRPAEGDGPAPCRVLSWPFPGAFLVPPVRPVVADQEARDRLCRTVTSSVRQPGCWSSTAEPFDGLGEGLAPKSGREDLNLRVLDSKPRHGSDVPRSGLPVPKERFPQPSADSLPTRPVDR
jgi:hypothetical protein